jgi:hypothetical protein
MCVFQNKLIVADYDVSSLYTIDENNFIKLSFLPARLNYSFNAFTNVDDRFLVSFFSDGSVYYTADLLSWDMLVPATGRNFLSIAYWENDKSIVLAERGDTGKIWKIDITELLNTGIEFDSEPEITIYSDNNYITINSNNNKILAIDILNILGKGIPLHFSTNSKEIRYCISQLTPGLYFVRCRNQNNLFIKKFIKY